MTYVPLLLSLFAVDMLAAISPGPNFVLVTETAIRRTDRHAAAVVSGLVTTNLIWCVAVALGLSAIFDLTPWLYRAFEIGGGAYLVYLGVTLWRSSDGLAAAQDTSFQNSLRAAYMQGVLTNLTNPKTIVYFGSIFALFMRPGTPGWVQMTAISIVIVDTVLWYGAVAVLFSRRIVQQRFAAVQRPIHRLAGAAMIAFGGRLMLVRR
jgi:threonine efflux protein